MINTPVSPSGRHPWKTACLRIVSLLLVLLVIVLLLVSFELYMRWQYRDVISTAHGFDYFMRKNFGRYHQENNEHGFRGRDFEDKHQAAYRIVEIGRAHV